MPGYLTSSMGDVSWPSGHGSVLCSQEEIDWLDVEVCCVATYIHDEDCYLDYMENKVHVSDPHIAHQV